MTASNDTGVKANMLAGIKVAKWKSLPKKPISIMEMDIDHTLLVWMSMNWCSYDAGNKLEDSTFRFYKEVAVGWGWIVCRWRRFFGIKIRLQPESEVVSGSTWSSTFAPLFEVLNVLEKFAHKEPKKSSVIPMLSMNYLINREFQQSSTRNFLQHKPKHRTQHTTTNRNTAPSRQKI